MIFFGAAPHQTTIAEWCQIVQISFHRQTPRRNETKLLPGTGTVPELAGETLALHRETPALHLFGLPN